MSLNFSGPAAAFALCVAVWGGSWFAIRAAVDGASPVGVAALRATAAAAVLVILALAVRAPRPGLRSVASATVAGTVLIGANFALVYWGAPRVDPGLAALFYATAPLQAALLVAVFGAGERPSPRLLVGCALGALAVAVAFVDPSVAAGVATLGAVAVLLGATTSAAGTILVRRVVGAHPLWLVAWANVGGALVLWPAHLVAGGGAAPTTSSGWIGFAYMLVGGSVLAFLAYLAVVREWGATRASFTTLVTPFVAMGIGAAIFSAPFTVAQLAGAALLVAAGYLALRPQPPRRGAASASATASTSDPHPQP